jgi:Ca-activated chloride channel homolog
MRKILILLGLFLFPALGLWAASQQQERQIEEEEPKPLGRTALRVDVQQIQVDVTVQDRRGNLIRGLTQEHFKIYEDKQLQTITNFSPIEAPSTIVLVTEYSNAIPWQFLYDVLIASYTFVDMMRKDDWVAVVAYDMRPEILVDFTQNKMEVHNALRRLNFPGFSESNLFDTVFDVLDRVQDVEGKVAMVLVSSGLDTFSKKNLDETLKRVRETNVVIYPVSIGGHMRARYEHRMGDIARMSLYQADAVLKEFAKLTGGHAYFPRFIAEYRGIFETISALLRHQYSLSYVPQNTERDGKYRRIRVEVEADIDGDGKPDKLTVNHRQGYTATKIAVD